MEPSESDLLKAARRGDSEALEQLLRRNQERVYRFGMRLCGSPEDAEDVLQDTLLTLAQSHEDFEGKASLSTWLYAVARSYCIKKRRRSKHVPVQEESLDARAELGVDLPDAGGSPEDAAATRQLEHALAQTIQSLEPEQREVLLLRDVEGLSATETAEILGLSLAATKSRLHRARLRVREVMDEPLKQ